MLLRALSLLVLALPVGDACTQCRVDARRTSLCAAHLDEETSTLREERSVMARSSVASERTSALERVARLTSAHTNAPSPNVARFLADGLHDSSLDVRRRALALLVDGQHREETVRGLIDGWRAALRLWKDVDTRLAQLAAEAPKQAATFDLQQVSDTTAYLEALLAALGEVHDERAYRELLNVFKWPLERTPGRFYVAATHAVLAVESRKGVECVLEFALTLESELAAQRVAPRFAAKEGLAASLARPLDNATSAHVEATLEALAHFAERRKLGAPAPKLGSAAQWRTWFKGAKDQLTERMTLLE